MLTTVGKTAVVVGGEAAAEMFPSFHGAEWWLTPEIAMALKTGILVILLMFGLHEPADSKRQDPILYGAFFARFTVVTTSGWR